MTRPQDVSYHHILLPRHALITAQRCPIESLFPGRQAVSAFRPDQRSRLTVARRWHEQLRLFPLTLGNRFFLAGQIPQQSALPEPAGKRGGSRFSCLVVFPMPFCAANGA